MSVVSYHDLEFMVGMRYYGRSANSCHVPRFMVIDGRGRPEGRTGGWPRRSCRQIGSCQIGGSWPGWSRTTITGSKDRCLAVRRRASSFNGSARRGRFIVGRVSTKLQRVRRTPPSADASRGCGRPGTAGRAWIPVPPPASSAAGELGWRHRRRFGPSRRRRTPRTRCP